MLRIARPLAFVGGLALAGCASASPTFSNPIAAPLGPYSQLAEANGFVFISGIVALSPATRELQAPDIEGQTQRIFETLDALLASQGLTRADVVKTTVYMRDAADMPAMNSVYAAYFSESRPARTTVPGADWGNSGILIEIEAIAVRRP